MSVPASDARPFLRDLNATGPARRLQGLVRLAERGDWTLQGLVAPHVDGKERDVRIGALVALRALGDRRWAPRALVGLGDDDPLVRGASAALLAALGPSPEEARALLERAGDTDFEVVRALLDLARRPAATLHAALPVWLPGALGHADAPVRRTAALVAEAAPRVALEAGVHPALERLRADVAPAPFVTSALDAWLAERGLAPRPEPAGRVATVGEAARRAIAAVRGAGRPASTIPAAYGWEVLFRYDSLPTAIEIAGAVWPGLDPDAIEVGGEMNPYGRHWTAATVAPRARSGAPVHLRVVRREDLVVGRLAFESDPHVPSLAAFDAKAAVRPGADGLLFVEVPRSTGHQADADRAAAWLGGRLAGVVSGPWLQETSL